MPEFQPVDHDPFGAAPQAGPLLMPVDHDPFGAHPGFTMDSDLSSLDAYDTIKLRAELANKPVKTTPEQQQANFGELVTSLAYASPIGNALSARDAMEAKWRGQELERQGDIEGARRAFAEAAANAGMAFLPGMGRVGLGRGAEGAASSTRVFAGPMAKTADHVALAQAKELERSGANADHIWHETGWERHPVDGKWRFEIDDSGARMKAEPPKVGKFGDFMEHQALSDAHPDLAEIPTAQFVPSSAPGAPLNNTLGLYAWPTPEQPNELMAFQPKALGDTKIPLHEQQHAVQAREGFTPGTSSRAFAESAVAPLAERYYQDMKQSGANLADEDMRANAISRARYQLYHRTAGEVEARNVERRAHMTAEERRNTPPWLTEDVYRMLQTAAPAKK